MFKIECPSCKCSYNVDGLAQTCQYKCCECGVTFSVAIPKSDIVELKNAKAESTSNSNNNNSTVSVPSNDTMQSSSGKTTSSGTPMSSKTKKVIGLGLLAVLMISVIIFVAIVLLKPTAPKWISPYLVNDTFSIIYADVNELKNSSGRVDLDKVINEGIDMHSIVIDSDDVEEFLVVIYEDSSKDIEQYSVLKVNSNTTVEDVVKDSREKEGERSEYNEETREKFKYKKVDIHVVPQYYRNTYLAAPADNYIIVSTDESAIKKVISHVVKEKETKLDEELESMLADVAGNDFFLAMMLPDVAKREIDVRIESCGMGIDVGDNYNVEGYVVFGSERVAKRAAKKIDKMKDSLMDVLEEIEDEYSSIDDVSEMLRTLLDSVKVSVSGDKLSASASMNSDDIDEIIETGKSKKTGRDLKRASRKIGRIIEEDVKDFLE